MSVTADTYPGHPFRAHVQNIRPATGAVFALVPPQNGSGSRVKVVQPVPPRSRKYHSVPQRRR